MGTPTIITIANNKGGVGKTTSTQNIGGGLARFHGCRVLLIDMDPQANLTSGCGVKQHEGPDVGDFILKDRPFDQVRLPSSTPGVDLLPSSRELAEKSESFKHKGMFPMNLKAALRTIEQPYDVILVDCPPALGDSTRLALFASQYYFVPMQTETFSYEGLDNLLRYATELSEVNDTLKLGGIFATRYNPRSRKRIAHDIIDAVRDQLAGHMMESYIRENSQVARAQLEGVDIWGLDAACPAAANYQALCGEIYGIITRHG